MHLNNGVLRAFASLTALAAAFTLGGCSVLTQNASAAPQSTHASASRTAPDDSYFTRMAEPGSWRDFTAEARAFGLSRLYVVRNDAPLKFGPHDSVWNIGTYGTKCLVTVGYPNAYSEAGLHGAPHLWVEVVNRYGGSRFKAENDSITYKAVATFVARSAARCT